MAKYLDEFMKHKSFHGILLLSLLSTTIMATETGDSVDVFQNQTVTTTVYVQGRDTIGIGNVEVEQTGKLVMKAPRGFTLIGDLSVWMGGRLELHTAKQWPVRYYYDSNGNTKARNKER